MKHSKKHETVEWALLELSRLGTAVDEYSYSVEISAGTSSRILYTVRMSGCGSFYSHTSFLGAIHNLEHSNDYQLKKLSHDKH